MIAGILPWDDVGRVTRGGIVDLTFEAHSDLDNLPSAAGRGRPASGLSADDWTVSLDDTALAELRDMVARMRAHPLPALLRRPDRFNAPALKRVYLAVKEICDNGVGFAVIDRLPMDEFALVEMVGVYWALGRLMAPNVAQKRDGTMIYDVTDTGKKYSYGVRGSATNVELVFHIDNAFAVKVPDYVGLLCRYPAKRGGPSRFCSLYTVHERMAQRCQAELRRLYQPMHFDRQAEHAGGAAKTSYAPFFSWADGKLRCRANSSPVRKGYQVQAGKMDSAPEAALAAVDEVTTSEDLRIEAPLERGRIQYLNNHELGHCRSEFEDNDDPATKRHLYRCGTGRKAVSIMTADMSLYRDA